MINWTEEYLVMSDGDVDVDVDADVDAWMITENCMYDYVKCYN